MTQTMDMRIQGDGQVIDRLGISNAFDDLNDFNSNDTSSANQAKAQNIANEINRPAPRFRSGAAGLYVKGHFGEHALDSMCLMLQRVAGS